MALNPFHRKVSKPKKLFLPCLSELDGDNLACFSVITVKFLHEQGQSKNIIVMVINYTMRMTKGFPSMVL